MIALMRPAKRDLVKDIEVKISEFTQSNEFASMHDLDSRILATEQR